MANRLTYSTQVADVYTDEAAFKDLQKGLSSATSGYIEGLKANATRIKKMQDEVDQKVGLFTSGQSDVEVSNPSVNFQETFGGTKIEYAAINRRIALGIATIQDKERAATLLNLAPTAKTSMVNMVSNAQSYDENKKSSGSQGGLDLLAPGAHKDQRFNDMKSMEIFNGRAPGTKKLITNLDVNPPVMTWKVYDENGKEIFSRTTTEIEQMGMQGGEGFLPIIPDNTSSFETVASSLNGKDGKLRPEFLKGTTTEDGRFEPEYKDRVIKTDESGTKTIQKYEVYDIEKIRSAIGNESRAIAAGMYESNVQSAISFYNNILLPNRRNPITGEPIEGKALLYTNQVWDDETKKLFEEAYVDYQINNYIQPPAPVGNPEIVRKTVTEPKQYDQDIRDFMQQGREIALKVIQKKDINEDRTATKKELENTQITQQNVIDLYKDQGIKVVNRNEAEKIRDARNKQLDAEATKPESLIKNVTLEPTLSNEYSLWVVTKNGFQPMINWGKNDTNTLKSTQLDLKDFKSNTDNTRSNITTERARLYKQYNLTKNTKK